jgi:hypothetical protein
MELRLRGIPLLGEPGGCNRFRRQVVVGLPTHQAIQANAAAAASGIVSGTVSMVSVCPLKRAPHAQLGGHKFALTGVSPRVHMNFEVTQTDRVLPIFARPADAENNFTAGS